MTLELRLDQWTRGWRGAGLAATVALIAGLPGLLALPALDRDEARFAQSTAQMLETGDVIDIRFQDEDRSHEPPLLHWLQAASVSTVSSAEAREIWAYRVPSLLGAMLAAGACAWGAAAFIGPRGGALAGAILGGGLVLSTEAGVGRPDALLCGLVTLAMAALARLYRAPAEGGRGDMRIKAVFWLALAAAMLDNGPAGPMTAAVTALALWAWDRRAPWLRRIGWAWGLIILAALVGPWLAAVTVRTDGEVWKSGLAAASAGVGPGAPAPPGLHALAAPVLLFPFAALLPAALVEGWKARSEPGPRFALCWLVPNWLILELAPGRQLHLALPVYGALAWLAAGAAARPWGAWTRAAGAALSLASALVVAVAAGWLARRYAAGDWTPGLAVASLAMMAGTCGALGAISTPHRQSALAGALALGLAAHGAFAAMLVPRLKPLWLAEQVSKALDRTGINPRNGLTPGPVGVVGFDEPSIVFALGTGTEVDEAADAAVAISEGRPVVVESSGAADFQRALDAGGWKASQVASVDGLDYVSGKAASLRVYRSDVPPPAVVRPPAVNAGRNAPAAVEAPKPGAQPHRADDAGGRKAKPTRAKEAH